MVSGPPDYKLKPDVFGDTEKGLQESSSCMRSDVRISLLGPFEPAP